MVPFHRSASWKFNMAQANANGALPGGFAKPREVRHATLRAEWMQSGIFDIPACNMDAAKDVLTGMAFRCNRTKQQYNPCKNLKVFLLA